MKTEKKQIKMRPIAFLITMSVIETRVRNEKVGLQKHNSL